MRQMSEEENEKEKTCALVWVDDAGSGEQPHCGIGHVSRELRNGGVDGPEDGTGHSGLLRPRSTCIGVW